MVLSDRLMDIGDPDRRGEFIKHSIIIETSNSKPRLRKLKRKGEQIWKTNAKKWFNLPLKIDSNKVKAQGKVYTSIDCLLMYEYEVGKSGVPFYPNKGDPDKHLMFIANQRSNWRALTNTSNYYTSFHEEYIYIFMKSGLVNKIIYTPKLKKTVNKILIKEPLYTEERKIYIKDNGH